VGASVVDLSVWEQVRLTVDSYEGVGDELCMDQGLKWPLSETVLWINRAFEASCRPLCTPLVPQEFRVRLTSAGLPLRYHITLAFRPRQVDSSQETTTRTGHWLLHVQWNLRRRGPSVGRVKVLEKREHQRQCQPE
jgi:hypothetical protein